MADHWTSLSATSRPLLARNAHRSLMACYVALDSRGAKGQVCLKFALPCISGDDLDFLSLAPPRDGERVGEGQEERQPRFSTPPIPAPFNCVSSTSARVTSQRRRRVAQRQNPRTMSQCPLFR